MRPVPMVIPEQALEFVERALETHPNCARASILAGDVLSEAGRYSEAIEAYRRVEQQDPDYLPEVVEPLRECASKSGDSDAVIDYLGHVMHAYGGITPTLALAELLEEQTASRTCSRLYDRNNFKSVLRSEGSGV